MQIVDYECRKKKTIEIITKSNKKINMDVPKQFENAHDHVLLLLFPVAQGYEL